MSTLLWEPPPLQAIMDGIERMRAKHPETVMLTISLKLRTTRFKEQILKVTQQRVTNMKSEVLEAFRRDLERIESGRTGPQFVDAILNLLIAYEGPSPLDRLESVRQAMLSHQDPIDPLALPVAILQMIADADSTMLEGMGAIRAYLDQWETENADKQLSNTLKRAASAKKRSSEANDEPRYTPEQIAQIRYAIILRKSLEREHAAQIQACRLAALAELAERNVADVALVQQFDQEIRKRSAGRVNVTLIDVLCACASRRARAEEDTRNAVAHLRKTLHTLNDDMIKQSRKDKKSSPSANPSLPFIRMIIHLLAVSESTGPNEIGIAWLRRHLNQWYTACSKDQQRSIQEKLQSEPSSDATQQVWYAVLLQSFLNETCTLSTDTLVLAELAEAITRGFGDGGELLYGLLSRCYGETSSRFKYPLPAVIRQSNFSTCAETILSWCQHVIDYQAEQDQKHQSAQRQPDNVQTVTLARGVRVTALPLIYRIWCAQEAAYRAAAATEVPIGPDVGKTLGNLDRGTQGARRASKRGRSSILRDRFVGKRGARRIKRWLLPPKVVAFILKQLEVLEYPEHFTEQQLVEAKATRHPYGIAKRHHRRSVKAIRPGQFRDQATKRPVHLGQLSAQQRYLLRVQMLELQAYAPEFAEIKEAIDRFTEPAPRQYPRIDPVIFTDSEAQQLPFESRTERLEGYETRRRAYQQDLDSFRDFRPRQGEPLDSYSPEKLFDVETMRAHSLERSAAALLPGTTQPISFHRTMNCELEPKAFTLLVFDRERDGHTSNQYSFVCELVGDEAPERATLMQRDHSEAQQAREFINYPGHTMQGHEGASLVFFAVEIGDAYQGRILREVYERQMHAPIICKKGCTHHETGEHRMGCAPKAAIATATITSKVNRHRHIEWFAHLTVPMPTPPCEVQPDAVMGIHERAGQLYFAVVGFHGQLIDIGEITIPAHVGLQTRNGMTSVNFAYEIAWAILRQSRTPLYTACIGIEDTAWKRGNVDLSADANYSRFAFPRERIAAIAELKAVQEGVFAPNDIRGVAPARDCGNCGFRSEGSGMWMRAVQRCPHCYLLGQPSRLEPVEDRDPLMYTCRNCSRRWEHKIPQLKCQRCGFQQYAPYNTALVVARRMLLQVSAQNKPISNNT